MKLVIPPKARPGPVPRIDWDQFADYYGTAPDSSIAQAITDATGEPVSADSVRRARIARKIGAWQKKRKARKA